MGGADLLRGLRVVGAVARFLGGWRIAGALSIVTALGWFFLGTRADAAPVVGVSIAEPVDPGALVAYAVRFVIEHPGAVFGTGALVAWFGVSLSVGAWLLWEQRGPLRGGARGGPSDLALRGHGRPLSPGAGVPDSRHRSMGARP